MRSARCLRQRLHTDRACSDSRTYFHAYCHPYTNAHGNADSDAYCHPHANVHRNADTNAYTHTHASPHGNGPNGPHVQNGR